MHGAEVIWRCSPSYFRSSALLFSKNPVLKLAVTTAAVVLQHGEIQGLKPKPQSLVFVHHDLRTARATLHTERSVKKSMNERMKHI